MVLLVLLQKVFNTAILLNIFRQVAAIFLVQLNVVNYVKVE